MLACAIFSRLKLCFLAEFACFQYLRPLFQGAGYEYTTTCHSNCSHSDCGHIQHDICNLETVAVDSISHGTAISPPLTTLVIFVALTALSLRLIWLGVVGLVGNLLLGILFLVAGLGEPIIRRILQAPSFGLVGAVTIGLSAITFFLLLIILIYDMKGLIARWHASA